MIFSPSLRSISLKASSIALTIALVASLGGCSEKTPGADTAGGGSGKGGGKAGRGGGGPAPVFVAKAARKVVPLTLDAIGAVEPIRTAALRSQVTGTLMKIAFQEGQDVKQGDPLFEIDSRPFKNALDSANADFQKISVQLENARSQVARYKALSADSMVSKEQYQTIQDNERALTAQAEASKAAIANARLQLEYSTIRAPLSGRTGNLGVHEGDLVRASDANTTLVTVNQISPIYVTFGVPQQYLGPLNKYRAAGEVAVTATPPGTDQAAEKGELTFIDNTVDSATGTIKLKATFANETHRLWPGQFANITIMLAAPEVLVVPASAIQNDQDGQHVFVVKEDNTAEFRKIIVERTHNEDAVITSGLTAGETVVTDGQLRVLPGGKVEIKDSAGSPGDGGAGAPGRGKGKGKAKANPTPA